MGVDGVNVGLEDWSSADNDLSYIKVGDDSFSYDLEALLAIAEGVSPSVGKHKVRCYNRAPP